MYLVWSKYAICPRWFHCLNEKWKLLEKDYFFNEIVENNPL